MKELATDSIDFASSYLRSIENMLSQETRRFDNDLLYNMISISYEKFMVGYLASLDQIAGSHVPLMLYREVKMANKDFDDRHKATAILIGKFEGICSLEDFGYKTPSDDEVRAMIVGLKDLRDYINLQVA
ncbi:MAG: hypothetical protein R3Y38_05470 [Rikenellaceae bacterium]